MSRIVVGVIGHVDHGKTALVRALTGMETDRLPEEKRRGISIALGFAHLPAEDGGIDLIDMPGHERFVRTMVAGATGIDAALLVVAANEGIKPQTVEHVDIAGLLGIRRAIVTVSKADLVAPAQADAVGGEAWERLRRAGLEAPRPVLTSSPQGTGIEALRQALHALGAGHAASDGVAFLPIDRVFSVAGHGTVVTGTLRGAPIAAGDVLELLPRRRTLRVRAVQVHGARVATAAPGQRVAVNLRDVEVGELRRGDALAAPDAIGMSAWLSISIQAVDDAPPLRNGARLQALFGTAEVEARLRLLDRDVLEPGERGFAQLHFAEPAAVPAREHLILRLASPPRTVAGGRVLEPAATRHRRRDTGALERFRTLAGSTPAQIVAAEIIRVGAQGTTLADLARLCALSPARVAQVLAAPDAVGGEAVVGRHHAVVSGAALTALIPLVRQHVARQEQGVSREALLAAMPRVGGAVLDEALARLIAGGALRETGGVLSLVRPDADRARAGSEALLAAEIAERVRAGGLAPLDAGAIAPALEQRRALDRLIREGVVVRAHDKVQKRFVLFHQNAVDEARRRLQPLLARPPGLSVSEVGAALGISRKFSVPLLEHLDAIRFTRRVQDRRMLAAPLEAKGTG